MHFAFASSLASPPDCEIDEVGEGGPEPEGGEEAGEGEVADTVRVGGTGGATFLMGLTGDESRGWLQQGFTNRNIFSSEER